MLVGSICHYLRKGQICSGIITQSLGDDFYVSTSDKTYFISAKTMILIENYPEKDWEGQNRPRFAYNPQEFLVLWNWDRETRDNLVDIFRYFNQGTKEGFKEEYWRFILSSLGLELLQEEMIDAWGEARFIEAHKAPVENDMSPYQPGQRVMFNLYGITVIFSNHAIERTFERIQVQKENFRTLAWQMLEESVPVKPPKSKQHNEEDVFLYNKSFSWTFILTPQNKAGDVFLVTTCYEPPLFWRKLRPEENTPFSLVVGE